MEANNAIGYSVGEPTEKITLHISCKNLADLDIITVSDPVCHVYMPEGNNSGEWSLYGKTEQIENSLNPEFVTYFEMDYYFERLQRLRFEVFDVDPTTLERIGNFETTLGDIMGSENTSLTGDLKMPSKTKSRGKIILRAEKTSNSNNVIHFDLKVSDLVSNKGFFCGSNDPFIYISRARSENLLEFIRVIQLEPIRNNLFPSWPY